MTREMSSDPPPGSRQSGAAALPKRFYTSVTVAAAAGEAAAFRVLLDGRAVKTPAKHALALPTRALTEAVAEEWRQQGERIDPRAMPLTRIVNVAIDGVGTRQGEVAADVAKYAGTDLVCYRADFPDALVARQRLHWDPLVVWARTELGCPLVVVNGLMPVAQPPAVSEAVQRAVAGMTAMQLAALHVMTTLLGSVVLALAVARLRITAEQAWTAGHVDEDHQIEAWGEDAEAAARRALRWRDMQAAARLMKLATDGADARS